MYSQLSISRSCGDYFLQVQITRSANSLQRQIMVGESNQNVFLTQIDTLNFAEFEISEFEIARVDCTSANGFLLPCCYVDGTLLQGYSNSIVKNTFYIIFHLFLN